MLVMTLMYSLLAIIIFVCKSIFLRNKKQTLISLSILLLEILLIFIFVYFLLPSRNLLSLLLGNAIFGGIFLILNLFIGNFDDDIRRGKLWVNKSFSIGLSVVMITLLIAVGGELHSILSVKPTYNSISVKKVSSKQAPTFKRGETPVALAPKTVLNRVRKAVSDLPNSQYYKIAGTVQAQYIHGKAVYIVPVEYQGFFAMMKAKNIPGYFMIDATSQNAKTVQIYYKCLFQKRCRKTTISK